ncbi:MAG: hypothetical protein NTV02_02105 [Candidatus Zambryskibacteria bacterium]|nr:hypothetical protein [Candidatus Zambryskibacteria bacterium]
MSINLEDFAQGIKNLEEKKAMIHLILNRLKPAIEELVEKDTCGSYGIFKLRDNCGYSLELLSPTASSPNFSLAFQTEEVGFYIMIMTDSKPYTGNDISDYRIPSLYGFLESLINKVAELSPKARDWFDFVVTQK